MSTGSILPLRLDQEACQTTGKSPPALTVADGQDGFAIICCDQDQCDQPSITVHRLIPANGAGACFLQWPVSSDHVPIKLDAPFNRPARLAAPDMQAGLSKIQDLMARIGVRGKE